MYIVHAFVLTKQLWFYSEAFLKHFSITSLQGRYVQTFLLTMLPWLYSEAFQQLLVISHSCPWAAVTGDF
jgi:hypothetical protein